MQLVQRLPLASRVALAAGWRAGRLAARFFPAVGCPRRHTSSAGATTADRAALSPDSDVETAVKYAVEAAGRQATAADLQLAAHLRKNWFTTAGDVAAMSPEELEMLQVPVKLWSILQQQVSRSRSKPPSPPHPPAAAAAAGTAMLTQTQQPEQQRANAQQQQQQHQHQHNTQHQSSSGLILQPPDPTVLGGDAARSAAGGLQQQVPLPADIMQRRMPQRAAPAAAKVASVRHSPLLSTAPYALKDSEISAALTAELQELEAFCTTRFFGQLVEPVRPVTHQKVTLHNIKMLLGYAHRVRGVPLEQLSLKTLLPSSDRGGVSLLLDFQRWRQQERGVSASTASNPIKTLVHVGRLLYHHLAQPNDPVTGHRQRYPYQSIEVMQELAHIQRATQKTASVGGRVADEAKKWLDWEEFLGMVKALRAECAGLTAAGQPRARREVAASLQRYLIVAILSVIPDRQRTLRELELGRTLLQRDGGWVIKHGPGDYKTGKKYGDRPPLVIAPFIYPELEAFISTWRRELQPQTNMLFCRARTGEAMTEDDLYYLFRRAAVRLTGKATHPHLVRDMIVTHLRMQQHGEAEMEALALYMAHSLEVQKASYDRRTVAQKVQPAMQLLQGLHLDAPKPHHVPSAAAPTASSMRSNTRHMPPKG